MKRCFRLAIAGAVAAGLVIVTVDRLRADTFMVTSAVDDVDANLADGVCSTAGGLCTLRAAIQQANALPPGPHVVVLPAGIFYLTRFGPPENAAVFGDLDILVSMTIQGAGRDGTIIDCLGADRVFDCVGAGPSLNIVDLTIRNGEAPGSSGGAINHPTPGDVSVTRVRFSGNYSGLGGAIFQGGPAANTMIVDCIFENNQVSGSGGAIHAMAAGLLSISGSSFTSNIATAAGGAVLYNGMGAITVDHTSFQQCQTIGAGGAMTITTNALITISFDTFENNTAMTSGGAIMLTGGPLCQVMMTNARFVSNTAGTTGGGCYSSAGGNMSFLDSRFEDNLSNNGGGGIYYIGMGSVVIENTDLVGNMTHSGMGGGMFGSFVGGAFTLTNATVADNWASAAGGGMCVAGRSHATITNASFLRNALLGGAGGGLQDGGIGPLTIYNSSFSQNTAGSNGGGGGLHSAGAAPASVWNSTFSGNEVSGFLGTGGGILYSAAPGATLTNCTFSGNVTSNTGGAVAVLSSMTFTNCTFAQNSALGGGASFVRVAPVFLQNTIVGAAFAGANCFGGALGSLGNNIDLDASCGLAGPGDQIAVDPRLGPLQDNGSGRLTHALLGGSPAIDAGFAGACTGVDERGVLRPLDGNGDGAAVCDIGAFEYFDCNLNGIDDTSEITATPSVDCNRNNIPDACDIASGLLVDTDLDGTPDICDTCTDTDGDGFGDPGFPASACSLDNCPTTPNPDQTDSNGDGVGNACAPAPPAPQPGPCGVCGLGVGMMMPLTLLGLGLMKRRRRRL